MFALRAMSMQKRTRARKKFLWHGDNDEIISLQKVLVSSCFFRFRKFAFDNAPRVRRARLSCCT
jgi:hypothetical protein